MNTDKYVNTLFPRPRREDFTKVYVYQRGKVIAEGYKSTMPSVYQDPSFLKEEVFQEDEYESRLLEYINEENQLFRRFKSDLFERLNWTSLPSPVRESLFALAWERGHGEGFSGVYNCALDYQDLVTSIIGSMKNGLNYSDRMD